MVGVYVRMWKLIFSLCTPVFTGLASERAEGEGLFALDDSAHAQKLYANLRNEEWTSEMDSAAFHPEIRKRICRELTNYGLLAITDFHPFRHSIEEFKKLGGSIEYAGIFNQIFAPTSAEGSYEYVNAYAPQLFFDSDGDEFVEYVFVCVMRNTVDGKLFPLFVSKEYNVGPGGLFYKPGRFIFENFVHSSMPSLDRDRLILAEEPVTARTARDLDVELYFLRVRKYFRPAESNSIDPLCRLISEDDDDPESQHYRFCVAVSTSSRFKDELVYPTPRASACQMKEVSFRTYTAQVEAASGFYYERMSLCLSDPLRQSDEWPVRYLYISRAYQSDHVLIYELDPSDHNIYLVNLSANISIVDELNSFDLIED